MAEATQTSGGNKAAVSGEDEDRFSALPDDALRHVLGFLPAVEAVRTCVLARRWRHSWKSARLLHVTRPQDGRATNDFVNPLLRLRDRGSALDEFNLDYHPNFHDHIDVWVRHAVHCKVRVLVLQFPGDIVVILKGPPLDFRHLRRLQLTGVDLEGSFLDFASCPGPGLEVLEMKDCRIYSERISSWSLRHLRVENCDFLGDIRARISVPNLVLLHLELFGGKAPVLEPMPLLQTACVEPAYKGEDYCGKGDSEECCGTCKDCSGDDGHRGSCVLLGGLSNVLNLELVAHPGMFIFRRDLRWCPTFGKLKKLFLNDWCVAIDLDALVCILQHSPVLENLNVELDKFKLIIETEGHHNLVDKPDAISERLKIIKVNCAEVDERVCKILNFLCTWVINFTVRKNKHLKNRRRARSSTRFPAVAH